MGLHVSCCPTEDWRWNSPSYCVSMEIFHFYLNWCVKCISHIPLRYHCSLCWYDRLLYELWIHDLCLNPSSTSQDVFYAETSRHSPPPGHAATWQPSDHVTGCHEPRDSGDPASCNEVPGPCYITRPCQTLAYRRDSYLKRWKLFWHNIRGELFYKK